MAYPTALSNYTGNETLFAAGHAQDHNALEAKLGISASTPSAGKVLRSTGTGISVWGAVDVTTDITGTLPVGNGGTGVTSSTGTVAVVLSTSPTLVTPVLGVATVTSINKVTITQPASSAILTILNGKTLTIDNTMEFAGTDSQVYTFPSASATIVGLATTQTITNKRITKRSSATAGPGATPTINTDTTDVAVFTALATAITSMTTNLSGTPVQGDTLRIAFTDNGTARAITWGASFESSGNVTLPSTTVLSVRLDVGFIWNTVTSKWRCVAIA